eukprot:TRINITY_DN2826_c0_g1_i1.p1 TRINITY_DN2826_c0_g1~~TRINITY_DN2826_c0_g1_i1.p1  ORF type:complete len:347 (-),score=50.24 TRINITY_DN2826_c0_g1_i1:164-1204(-)
MREADPDTWFDNTPIAIKHSEDRGRFAVARNALKRGDMILEEGPYALVVDGEHVPYTCRVCWKNLDVRKKIIQPFSCDACQKIYYCSRKCRHEDVEHKGSLECRALNRLKEDPFFLEAELSEIRLLIKILSRRDREIQTKSKRKKTKISSKFPTTFESVLGLASNHHLLDEDRIEELDFLARKVLEVLLVDEKDVPDVESLMLLLSIGEVNGFGLWLNDAERIGFGLYVRSSLFNHSCYPSVGKLHSPTDKISRFYALRDLAPDEPLTYSYIDITLDADKRRLTTKLYYMFECDCVRCSEDNKELDKLAHDMVCKRPGCLGVIVWLSDVERVCKYCGPVPKDYHDG